MALLELKALQVFQSLQMEVLEITVGEALRKAGVKNLQGKPPEKWMKDILFLGLHNRLANMSDDNPDLASAFKNIIENHLREME